MPRWKIVPTTCIVVFTIWCYFLLSNHQEIVNENAEAKLIKRRDKEPEIFEKETQEEPPVIDETNENVENEEKSSFENGLLTDEAMERIEKRFLKRRELLSSTCRKNGLEPVETFDQIRQLPTFKDKPRDNMLLNHIMHEYNVDVYGCIPPKTGSTTWNKWWWNTSPDDKSRKFDSFQTQGNQHRANWGRELASKKPELLFLQVRHPLSRLVSGWNNILCNENCRNADRVRYSKTVISRLQSIYKRNQHPAYSPKHTETIRMTPFEDWVDVILENNFFVDDYFDFDIHFHSYKRACHPCGIPYKYIIKVETFAEDFQFVLRKHGVWDQMIDKAKEAAGSTENKSIGLEYQEVLDRLTPEQYQALLAIKSEEMEMFGYGENFTSLD